MMVKREGKKEEETKSSVSADQRAGGIHEHEEEDHQ